ncbi:chromobox protein homolog 1-like isoform X2 [Phlebotomus argentipes]|uniref:chromobox protein homolog 1-like isoform X2 n=1 Tax=Phlebotomus argentipes TaxID=94469 RepID=UPI002892DB0F|nr:chromobox protein homolog 1-like isoform X2 [Phlebotomus argentipes]
MGKKKQDNSSSDSEGENEYQVESIIDRRVKKGRVEYYIKWEGYSAEDNTWEPIDNLDCQELIEEFEASRPSSSKDDSKDSISSKPRKSGKRKGIDDESDDESVTKKAKKIPASSDDSDKEGETEAKKEKPEKSKTKKPKSTDSDNHRAKNGDTKELVPETILGATDINGPLMFLIKWKGTDKAELIPAKEANIKFPQAVIAFYEQRLIWHSVKDKTST